MPNRDVLLLLTDYLENEMTFIKEEASQRLQTCEYVESGFISMIRALEVKKLIDAEDYDECILMRCYQLSEDVDRFMMLWRACVDHAEELKNTRDHLIYLLSCCDE